MSVIKIVKLKSSNKKIPTYCGRKMKEIKKYPNFILYEDPKTKIRSCFSYEDLELKEEN